MHAKDEVDSVLIDAMRHSEVEFLLLQPPVLTLPPAYDPEFKLQDGKPVTRELYDTLVAMIKQINQAIADLSSLTSAVAAAAA